MKNANEIRKIREGALAQRETDKVAKAVEYCQNTIESQLVAAAKELYTSAAVDVPPELKVYIIDYLKEQGYKVDSNRVKPIITIMW